MLEVKSRMKVSPISLLRGVISAGRNGTILILLFAVLLSNIASFTIAPIASAMLDIANRMALSPVVSTATELQNARIRASELYAEKLKMERQVERLSQRRKENDRREKDLKAELARLEGERADVIKKNSVLTGSVQKLEGQLADSRMTIGQLEKRRPLPDWQVEKLDRITARIGRRSADNAMRNIASIPLESVPILGPLTIVSVTALEVKDACQSLEDMEALRIMAGRPASETDRVSQVCSLIVHTPGLPNQLTISQCRAHAENIRAELGSEAAKNVDEQCDCLELPDGCPAPAIADAGEPDIQLP
ncbi:hypothetical protein [Palleronia sp.]|uniref:hypothetical protein n=1 Tax=Palleronia sp. TaxID=1940284 RepID=UPI0035C7F823